MEFLYIISLAAVVVVGIGFLVGALVGDEESVMLLLPCAGCVLAAVVLYTSSIDYSRYVLPAKQALQQCELTLTRTERCEITATVHEGE
jgi:hypothetical protein